MKSEEIIESILKEAMAMPRDIDYGRTYYHGTSSSKAAHGIFSKGIEPPNLDLRPQNKLTPVKGKVYLTTDLKYAVIYALGGDIAGSKALQRWIDEDRYGYVFIVDGKELKDIQPDEDSVGEMLYDELKGKAGWLAGFAKKVLTPLQLEKVMKYDDYADLATAGRKLVKEMSDKQKLDLIDAGAHVANEGKVNFKQCWRIDKSKSEELKEDGSNFFQLAEKVTHAKNKNVIKIAKQIFGH